MDRRDFLLVCAAVPLPAAAAVSAALSFPGPRLRKFLSLTEDQRRALYERLEGPWRDRGCLWDPYETWVRERMVLLASQDRNTASR